MTSTLPTLADFGWQPYFHAQLSPETDIDATIARVTAVDRDRLSIAGPSIERTIAPWQQTPGDERSFATVGDWLLLDSESGQPVRLLERSSLLSRRAAGTRSRLQLIGANIDTLLIVSSCNDDFNPARLERYLALARESEITPIVVLTKADQVESPDEFVHAASQLMSGVMVLPLDARQAQARQQLQAWCERGQTLALLGSSGVGKSTLVNTLCGQSVSATQAIREDDAKGRHTTTARRLHRLSSGGWLLDTPGMRELQLTDTGAGIDGVFDDVVALAKRCRFGDCQHTNEPGCAVQAAIAAGTLEAARLYRWQKLQAENSQNTRSVAERRARAREQSKLIRQATRNRR